VEDMKLAELKEHLKEKIELETESNNKLC